MNTNDFLIFVATKSMAKKKRERLPFSGNRVRPRVRKKDLVNKKFDRRYLGAILRWAGKRKLKIRMKYMRIQDGRVKTYTVEPYSFRYRKTRDGVRKMFFAYHVLHRRIHGFVLRNILEISVLDKSFKPRWTVELK